MNIFGHSYKIMSFSIKFYRCFIVTTNCWCLSQVLWILPEVDHTYVSETLIQVNKGLQAEIPEELQPKQRCSSQAGRQEAEEGHHRPHWQHVRCRGRGQEGWGKRSSGGRRRWLLLWDQQCRFWSFCPVQKLCQESEALAVSVLSLLEALPEGKEDESANQKQTPR